MKIGETVFVFDGQYPRPAELVSFDDETACIMTTSTSWDDGDGAEDHQWFEFVPVEKVKSGV